MPKFRIPNRGWRAGGGGGGGGSGPTNNFTATTNPTINDDTNAGYSLGSLWLNKVTPQLFICTDPAAGAAVWESFMFS